MAECNAENWAGLSTSRCAEPQPPPAVDAGSLSRAASTAEPELSLTAWGGTGKSKVKIQAVVLKQQYTTLIS